MKDHIRDLKRLDRLVHLPPSPPPRSHIHTHLPIPPLSLPPPSSLPQRKESDVFNHAMVQTQNHYE
jgi:hypothetical protein